MAKAKQERGQKSTAIRELLAKNPKQSVKEVVGTLAQRGIQVKANHVYLVKSKMKDKQRRTKRDQAVAAGTSAGVTNPAELVRMVKGLATKAGGMRNLKQLVDVLAE